MSRPSSRTGQSPRASEDAKVSIKSPAIEPSGAPGKPEKELAAVETEASTIYPPLSKVIPVMISIFLSMFMTALDRMIISTAIPVITDEFNSIGDIGWYTSAYMISMCALQLIFGRIYTFWSPKWAYLVSVLIFEVGSVICGAAPNSAAFIIGRAIAGVGSAGLLSGCIMLIIYMIPLQKRPMWQGMMGAVFMVASIVGPLLGGAFTTKVTWRWCFYINLPLGGVALILALLFVQLPENEDQKSKALRDLPLREKLGRMDLIGASVFLPSIVCLLLALQWGGSTYSWGDARIIVLFIIFGLSIIAFCFIQVKQGENAMVPVRILTYRSVVSTAWFAFFTSASMTINTVYLPTWFQAIQGVDAIESGIRTLPMIIGVMVTSVLGGVGLKIIGYFTPLLIASSCILSVGAGLLTTFTVHTPSSHWIGYQALYGLGIGLGQQQAGMAAQTVLPRKDVSTGAAIKFLGQNLGGAIFASVAQNVLSNQLVEGLGGISGLDATQIVNTGATDLRNVVGADQLPAVLSIYNGALVKTFQVALVMACVSIIPSLATEWVSIKGKKGRPDAGKEDDKNEEKKGTENNEKEVPNETA